MPDSVACHVESGQDGLLFLTTNGNREGLNELFGECMPRLFRVADCVLHNHHDSEDALQDGLLSALRHIKQFRGHSQFPTWLHSIIRNSALGSLRRQRAHPMVSIDDQACEDDFATPDAPVDPGPDPERWSAQAELSFKFARTLEGLPENYREIIRLCDFEGFSGREAARQLGLTVSALKAQHHRARRAIRKSISARVEGRARSHSANLASRRTGKLFQPRGGCQGSVK